MYAYLSLLYYFLERISSCFFFSRWGLKNNIDFIAASFIRKASDVVEIQQFCAEQIQKLKLPRSVPLIISKIESTEALENFSAILEVTDAIMIARGDLAVEIPMETLAAVQKEIVRQCNHVGKPVIVATQMLETMQKNPRPTRAEITDVANAIVDGTDCVMLSGESAKGKYPVESVTMMRRIIQETELNLQHQSLSLIAPQQHSASIMPSSLSDSRFAYLTSLPKTPMAEVAKEIFQTIISKDPLSFHGIILQLSTDEKTIAVSKMLSKGKLLLPIFLPVQDYKTARLLSLYQCLYPVIVNNQGFTNEQIVHQIYQRFGNETFQNVTKKRDFLIIRDNGADDNNLTYELL